MNDNESIQNHGTGHRAGSNRLRGAVVWSVVIGLVVLLVVGIGAGVASMKDSEPADVGGGLTGEAAWFNIAKRSFDLRVDADGEMDALSKIELKCEVEGQTTIVDIVPEGKAVKAGEVLVTLASDAITERYVQETLSVATARADLISAESGLAITENKAAADQSSAELKLRLAELDLAKWISGTDPQSRREKALMLEKTRRTSVKSQRDLELSRQLESEKFISWGELEDDEIKSIEAKAALETAELDAKIYEEYTRPKEEQQARSDVEQARVELDRVKRENARNLDRARADLQGRAEAMKIREERLAKLKEQIDKTVITAPQDGLVVYATSVGPNSRRNTPMSQGRQVRLGEAIIILPDMRQMVASVRVNEALVGQLKVDQRTTVVIEALGKDPIEGKISQIGVMAEDGGWFNPDLREYAVRIELHDKIDEKLKPGMRCKAEIFIGRVEDAVAVPVQAVITEGDKRFCYARVSGGVEKRNVKIGRSNESFVEITGGLSEGESVLLRRPRAGEVLNEKAS